MGSSAEDPGAVSGRVVDGLRGLADPARAAHMRAYMRDQFPFLGIPAPERRRVSRPLVVAARGWTPAEGRAVVDGLWALPEREFRYVGCDVARATARGWAPGNVADLRRWVTTDSWWDTVDQLAVATGDLVGVHPELVVEMDRWIADEDPWVARVALLHQLGWKERLDLGRLFSYCDRRAGDTGFFVRKAIGWALRDAARTHPEEVRAFVIGHPGLSGLSRREALRRLAP